jgi:hypothetical protein
MNGIFTLTGQLRLVGVSLVLLGLAHVAMPRALAWSKQFGALDPLNRRIMYVHTLFIGLTCVLLGLAPLALTAELLSPAPMSTAVLVAECGFWTARWCVQFTAFPPALWRHSRLHFAGYLGLSLLWTWIVAVFAVALAGR